mgnify:CR=1 FL=1
MSFLNEKHTAFTCLKHKSKGSFYIYVLCANCFHIEKIKQVDLKKKKVCLRCQSNLEFGKYQKKESLKKQLELVQEEIEIWKQCTQLNHFRIKKLNRMKEQLLFLLNNHQ